MALHDHDIIFSVNIRDIHLQFARDSIICTTFLCLVGCFFCFFFKRSTTYQVEKREMRVISFYSQVCSLSKQLAEIS